MLRCGLSYVCKLASSVATDGLYGCGTASDCMCISWLLQAARQAGLHLEKGGDISYCRVTMPRVAAGVALISGIFARAVSSSGTVRLTFHRAC